MLDGVNLPSAPDPTELDDEGDAADAYTPGDVPLDDIDWVAVERLQAEIDTLHPDDTTGAMELLHRVHR